MIFLLEMNNIILIMIKVGLEDMEDTCVEAVPGTKACLDQMSMYLALYVDYQIRRSGLDQKICQGVLRRLDLM